MPSSEILAVLADEVTEAGNAIGVLLTRIVVATDETVFSDALTEYLEQVRRISAACDALNLDGLRAVCAFIESNVAVLSVGGLGPERQALFELWPQLVLGYLKAPRDSHFSHELVALFQRTDWPQPLDGLSAKELEQVLVALNESDDAADAMPARERIALADDVVLCIPQDVNPKLVDAFLTEGPQQAGEYSTLIQRVIRGDGFIDELNECRRMIHGLKGAANTVGVRGVAVLCHHVEDILEFLVESAVRPEGELARSLVKVADTLEMMFEDLLGTGQAPADAQAVLQDVLDWMNRIESGEYDPAASRNEAAAMLTQGKKSTASAARSPARVDSIEAKVRMSARTVDTLLRTSGELSISGGHVNERLQQALKILAELRERHTALWDRSNDMDNFVTTQGIAAGRRQALAVASDAGAGFDPLELDQYSELHTYVHGLAETVADLQLLGARLTDALTTVDTAVNQQVLLNDELHELLMTSRMVPAGNLDSRLQRTVRQAAEQCGKLVTLTLEGADVMLDDQMVNLLIDPLQHLLRNAVDHGLEAPDVRTECEKPATGQIVLSFGRDGNYLLIICGDDGAGLDLARIHAHAVKRGLITEDQNLTEDEIARLILRSGLSTAQTLTEVSGRGVGMDVVHTSVAKLKGTIGIRSLAGCGATFTLRVPMSLGIVHCLLAAVGDEKFALPTDNLERIVYGGARYIVHHAAAGWFYSDGDVSCPAHALSELVGYAATADLRSTENNRHVILMDHVGEKIAIVVDAITGGQDLVIKNMGRYLTGVKGVIGASILGDGSVVPILELTDLMQVDRDPLGAEQRAPARVDARALKADVLVVDDSLSGRTALATLLAEQGFRVRTAKDGVEAIEAIDERRPAIVLADLEMPRMNGLELTAHIRTNAATRTLPVIMVTSRTAEKHRSQAKAAGVDDYVTKPYGESDLMLRVRSVLSKVA